MASQKKGYIFVGRFHAAEDGVQTVDGIKSM